MLFILPNIQEVGYWLSFIIIILIFIDKLFCKHFKLILILPLLPILSKAIWNYGYISKAREAFSSFALLQEGAPFTQAPFVSIFNLILKARAGEFSTIKLIMWKFLLFYSSTALCTYLIIAITLIFIKTYRSELLKDFLRFLIILFFGFCLYMLFRIDLYLSTSYLRIEAIEVASYERYFISYTIVFSFCALSFIKIILEAGALEQRKLFYFACISLFIGIISLKQIQYKLFDLDPYYFKDRQNVIKDLIKNGLNDNLDFKKYI